MFEMIPKNQVWKYYNVPGTAMQFVLIILIKFQTTVEDLSFICGILQIRNFSRLWS